MRRIKPEYLFTIFYGCFFVLLASLSTSPIYNEYWGSDSAQFMTIGMSWARGLVPYVEVFDHKGPFIFFVDMIGFILTGNKTGVFMIQLLFMSFTAIFLLKMAKLGEKSAAASTLIVCFAIVGLYISYYEGNSTEEFCLPFLTVGMYGQIKYLLFNEVGKSCKAHSPLWGAMYGITFAICFLTRVTNAVAIGGGIFVIVIILVMNKKFKNIFQNMCMFILGFVMTIFPFAAYFFSKGAFSEFLYGTIGYNLQYNKNMESWLQNATIETYLEFASKYYSCLLLFLVILLSIYNKRYMISLYSFVILFLELILFTHGALYQQYAIITAPNMVLLGNEVFELKRGDTTGKCIKKIGILSIFLVTVAFSGCLFFKAKEQRKESALTVYTYDVLLDYIPNEERESFIAYGDNDLKSIYLRMNQVPYYKFFAIQEWHGYFSQEVRSEICEVYSDGNAKWIMINEPPGIIADVIVKRYKLVAEDNGYYLYRLCEGSREKEIEDGWHTVAGAEYWYENGVRQGYNPLDSSYRGKELYDEETNSWCWLDNQQKGAKVKNKDVYLDTFAGEYAENRDTGTGKWVRYDSSGNMIRGWDYTENGIYYFDENYGTMFKGKCMIDGKYYLFDEMTGKLITPND